MLLVKGYKFILVFKIKRMVIKDFNEFVKKVGINLCFLVNNVYLWLLIVC